LLKTDIETYANVYVTAETQGTENAAFSDEELSPEVMAGLDDDQHGDQAAPPDDDEAMNSWPPPLIHSQKRMNFRKSFSEEFEGEFDDEVAEDHTGAIGIASHNTVAEELAERRRL